MGFQFCGFLRRRDEIDEFAAVRSDQMASRSGQERKPPRTSIFGFSACNSASRRGNQLMISGLLIGGISYKTTDCGSLTRIAPSVHEHCTALCLASAMPTTVSPFYCKLIRINV